MSASKDAEGAVGGGVKVRCVVLGHLSRMRGPAPGELRYFFAREGLDEGLALAGGYRELRAGEQGSAGLLHRAWERRGLRLQ